MRDIILSQIGISVIITSIASVFAKIFINKVLQDQIRRHNLELEEVKQKYSSRMEKEKVSNSLFIPQQFHFYNELWIKLCELEDFVDELWDSPSRRSLQRLSSKLKRIQLTIKTRALIIEPDHYRSLDKCLKWFDEFKVGKEMLLFQKKTIGEDGIVEIIGKNKSVRDEIKLTINEVMSEMKLQIKGS